jgi:hypothetical protein
LSVALPANFSVVFSAQGAPYLRPSFAFTQVMDATKYSFNIVHSPTAGSNHLFDVEIEPGWLQAGQAQLTFPDFSQVSGFSTSWVAPNPGSVAVKAAVYAASSDAGTALKSESGRSATLQVP